MADIARRTEKGRSGVTSDTSAVTSDGRKRTPVRPVPAKSPGKVVNGEDLKGHTFEEVSALVRVPHEGEEGPPRRSHAERQAAYRQRQLERGKVSFTAEVANRPGSPLLAKLFPKALSEDTISRVENLIVAKAAPVLGMSAEAVRTAISEDPECLARAEAEAEPCIRTIATGLDRLARVLANDPDQFDHVMGLLTPEVGVPDRPAGNGNAPALTSGEAESIEKEARDRLLVGLADLLQAKPDMVALLSAFARDANLVQVTLALMAQPDWQKRLERAAKGGMTWKVRQWLGGWRRSDGSNP